MLKCLKIKSALILIFVLLFATGLKAQIHVVQYMKVKDDKFSEYLEVEEAWSKLHQKLVDDGSLLGWTLYGKMFGGTNDEYDYITVNTYSDWEVYEKPFPENFYADNLGEEIMNKTGEVRDLIKTEVYVNSVIAENSKPNQIMQLTYMKVDHRNFEKYIDLEKKHYKPFHEALIEAGARNSWGIYQRIAPWGGNFNFVAINGFDKLSQSAAVSGDAIDAAWENARQGVAENQINEETFDAREMVHSEYWRRVMGVQAEQ